MIFHCVYFLKLNGFKANDNCTISRNGPILMVDERVMIKIAQIDELRRNEARVNRNLKFDFESTAISNLLDRNLNANNNVTSPLNLNRELAIAKPVQRIKSKKSVFPIYF